MRGVALLLLGPLRALALLALRRPLAGIRPPTTPSGITSARFPAIGYTETERLLTAHLLSRHGTCSALPATTSSSELAGRHRPREARSRRSMIGRQRPHATQSPLSHRQQSRQRHLRLRARELEISAVRDTNGRE